MWACGEVREEGGQKARGWKVGRWRGGECAGGHLQLHEQLLPMNDNVETLVTVEIHPLAVAVVGKPKRSQPRLSARV